MSPVREIVHITGRVLRELRWGILAWLAAIALALRHTVALGSPLGSAGDLGLVGTLLGAMLLAALAVLADPPSEPRAIWATLPMRRVSLIASRFLFVGGLLLVPLAAQAWVLALHAPSPARFLALLADSTLETTRWVVLAALVAALVRDARGLLIGGAALLAFMVGTLFFSTVSYGGFYGGEPGWRWTIPLRTMLLLAAALAAIALLYRIREAGRWVRVPAQALAAVLSVATVGEVAESAGPAREPTMGEPEPVAVRGSRVFLHGRRLMLGFGIEVPRGTAIVRRMREVTVVAEDGSVTRLHPGWYSGEGWDLVGWRAPGVSRTSGAPRREVVGARGIVLPDDETIERVARPLREVVVEGVLDHYEVREIASLPLRPGARAAHDERRLHLDPEFANGRLTQFRITESRLRRVERNRPARATEYGDDSRRLAGTLRYVLVRGDGTEVPLVENGVGFGNSGSLLVLPGITAPRSFTLHAPRTAGTGPVASDTAARLHILAVEPLRRTPYRVVLPQGGATTALAERER